MNVTDMYLQGGSYKVQWKSWIFKSSLWKYGSNCAASGSHTPIGQNPESEREMRSTVSTVGCTKVANLRTRGTESRFGTSARKSFHLSHLRDKVLLVVDEVFVPGSRRIKV